AVEIIGQSDSRAPGRFRSPFSADEIRQAISALDVGHFEDERTKSFGAALFEALINGKVKRVFDASDGNAESTGVRLILDDPEAAWIPWELMLDPTTGVPFAARHRLGRGVSTPPHEPCPGVLPTPFGV